MFFEIAFKRVNLFLFQTVQMKAMSQFIVDDIDDDILDEEDDSNEDEEVYDAVCAFCDNGGDILWYALFGWLFGNFFVIGQFLLPPNTLINYEDIPVHPSLKHVLKLPVLTCKILLS